MHKPVLLKEVIENFNIQENGFYIDATFGRGGHSKEILKKLGANGRLLVIDKDLEALCAFADRHYILEKGKVAWQGSSSELRSQQSVLHDYIGV